MPTAECNEIKDIRRYFVMRFLLYESVRKGGVVSICSKEYDVSSRYLMGKKDTNILILLDVLFYRTHGNDPNDR